MMALEPGTTKVAAARTEARHAVLHWRGALIALAVVAAAIMAYWPALHGAPVWDDDAHLTTPSLRSWAGLARIWTEPGATQQYYPALHTAFWIEHRFWGDAVAGYHWANLIQHLLAAGLFALVLRRLAVPGAALAAAIFALHPVHVESVAWISEQKNTLSLVWQLGAALCYLRFDASRRSRDYWAGLLLFALALLTKSVTAMLPATLLVVLWWRHGRLTWRGDVGPLVPWLLLGAAAGLFTAWVERHLIIGGDPAAVALTLAQRLLLAARVVGFYLGHLLWPERLTFLYPRWTVDARSALQWLPLLTLPGVAWVGWIMRRHSRAPLAALLVFVGTLFPVLGFFDVYPFRFSWVADHFQYAADLAVIALLAAGASRLTRRPAPGAAKLLGTAGLAALTMLTAAQTPMYRDAPTLYRETLRRNPDCWMAHNNLALVLSATGRREEALQHLHEAIRLQSDYFDGHNNLGLFLAQLGRPREALPHLEAAVRLKPTSAEARNNLGIALAALGDYPHAVLAFEAAVRFMPASPNIHDNFAKALRLAGRSSQAQAEADRAAQLRAAAAAR